LRGGLHRLLIARGEGAQRMLHAVAELAQHAVGDIERVLRDEVDADTLGADQAYHLFHFFQQRGRRFVEQQVGFVEEEHQLGLVQIAGFRQLLEQFGQQPEQEGGVQARRVHQLFAGEDVDDAVGPGIGLHQVGDIQHRLTEKVFAALLLDLQQAALNGADRRGGNVAVFGLEFGRMLADMLHHGAQILQIEQQQALVVGDLEHQLQHAGLGVVQIEQAAEQQRAHIRDGRAHRMALLAVNVPEHDGAGGGRPVVDLELFQSRLQLV
jgi:hypothetical protein